MRALVAAAKGEPARLVEVDEAALGAGEVTVAVQYSSLNYKDGLAVGAAAAVVRRFPLILGIDLAGEVIDSTSPAFRSGDKVLVTGCGLGEEHPGGYANLARVPSQWCVPLPEGRDALWAMTFGTAGLTAMLACMALERDGLGALSANELPFAVTGAAGGVGSIAVFLLARLGCRVVASTGRPEEGDFLRGLGASEVISREELFAPGSASLASMDFAGAIDPVGGAPLAELLRRVQMSGVVAACGLTAGAELHTTVYPFILRGITLAGVNSVRLPDQLRSSAWARLAEVVDGDAAARLRTVEPLSAVPALASEILAGRVRGRIVVDVTT